MEEFYRRSEAIVGKIFSAYAAYSLGTSIAHGFFFYFSSSAIERDMLHVLFVYNFFVVSAGIMCLGFYLSYYLKK